MVVEPSELGQGLRPDKVREPAGHCDPLAGVQVVPIETRCDGLYLLFDCGRGAIAVGPDPESVL